MNVIKNKSISKNKINGQIDEENSTTNFFFLYRSPFPYPAPNPPISLYALVSLLATSRNNPSLALLSYTKIHTSSVLQAQHPWESRPQAYVEANVSLSHTPAINISAFAKFFAQYVTNAYCHLYRNEIYRYLL